MKKLLVLSAMLIVSLMLVVQLQAQQRVRSVSVGGTPLLPDNLVNGPVPRLPDGHPDLTGPWMGGGSNADIEADGGLKPGELPLLPWAKELRGKRTEEDEPYVACLPMSVPRVNPYPWKFAMSYTSKGLAQIYILHETGDAGAHRVVYMDGRKHPDLSRWTPTGSGHSVGHAENGELVVDTIGIATGGVTAGGWRTPETHLIEHFVVSPDGQHLTINYRWEDPKIYQKPHEYHYELDRLPAGSYAFEEWCDASDPIEQQSIVPPAQQ